MIARSVILSMCLVAATAGCGTIPMIDAPPPPGASAEPPRAERHSFEARLVDELNFARTDPAGYAQVVAERLPTYDGKEGKRAIRECIEALRRMEPRRPLSHSRHLARAARDHVDTQSRTGRIGHDGSDGSTPFSRIDRYVVSRGSGENIQYGLYHPRDIVVELLVDDGIPDRGHRINILDPDFEFVGVAAGPHPRYRTMSVMDFTHGHEPW